MNSFSTAVFLGGVIVFAIRRVIANNSLERDFIVSLMALGIYFVVMELIKIVIYVNERIKENETE